MSARTQPPVLAYRMKMSREVAAHIKNKPVVGLKIPLIFGAGSRLFLIEWNGGPTGRADLCTVMGTDGTLLLLERRWCWADGKTDDDLSALGIVLQENVFPLVTAAAIP